MSDGNLATTSTVALPCRLESITPRSSPEGANQTLPRRSHAPLPERHVEDGQETNSSARNSEVIHSGEYPGPGPYNHWAFRLLNSTVATPNTFVGPQLTLRHLLPDRLAQVGALHSRQGPAVQALRGVGYPVSQDAEREWAVNGRMVRWGYNDLGKWTGGQVGFRARARAGWR